MQVFSPFGPVESLKVIPDKECAFINFTRVEDAMRAKEDISERRGGRIGNATVRVGYGKAELMNNADAPVLHPTRALWIGNIPASTTPAALHAMFSHFGTIESARVLTHKSCGFINFENMEDAVIAKKVMHGQEVFGPGTGAVRIGFAKVPTKQSPSDSPSPGHGDPMDIAAERATGASNRNSRQDMDGPTELDRMLSLMTMAGKSQSTLNGEREPTSDQDPAFERLAMLQEFNVEGETEPAQEPVPASLTEPVTYFPTIPAVAEPSPHRRLDAPRLREIRKRLDSGHCTQKDLDSLSNECMDECVELCSDYIGNTVMQKLFERCSETQKTKMLELIAPHLASIGVHKNGTWAAQKIIDCAKSPAQTELICKYVRPFTPPLLLDQFGNYVVQCCLRLGQSRNGFIFEAMADKFWEIAQGRFGARAMRASLESQHASKRQQKHVAVAVVQNALALATNPNGTLMLTWLLDNSQLAGRYRVLAPRLAPHMATLATHKLASLTILKVINQRQEPEASEIMINSIVHSNQDQVLVEILGDQVHGVSLIQKILASPNVEQQQKHALAEKVKAVLSKLSAQTVQGCKRLLEEVNLVLGGDSSTPDHLKMTPGSGGYPPAEYAASAASFYAAMTAGQHQLHALSMPGSDGSTMHESGSGMNSESQDGNHAAGSSTPLTPGGHIASGGMGHAGAYSMQHNPYYSMPHNQVYGHYPGQMSPYYGPGTAFIPQPITTMGYPGMMPQAGFNPYVAMAPPGIGGGMPHPSLADGSQLNGSAMFLQQQQQQQQQQQLYHMQQQQQQQQQQFQQQQ
ncbi:MAG: armadillo-type protein [Linnemannia gamsii]|nr:MAG: armadillo-type protein [Linnemannia gamsii]